MDEEEEEDRRKFESGRFLRALSDTGLMNSLKRGWKAVARSAAGEFNQSPCINILSKVENFAIFRL